MEWKSEAINWGLDESSVSKNEQIRGPMSLTVWAKRRERLGLSR